MLVKKFVKSLSGRVCDALNHKVQSPRCCTYRAHTMVNTSWTINRSDLSGAWQQSSTLHTLSGLELSPIHHKPDAKCKSRKPKTSFTSNPRPQPSTKLPTGTLTLSYMTSQCPSGASSYPNISMGRIIFTPGASAGTMTTLCCWYTFTLSGSLFPMTR